MVALVVVGALLVVAVRVLDVVVVQARVAIAVGVAMLLVVVMPVVDAAVAQARTIT